MNKKELGVILLGLVFCLYLSITVRETHAPTAKINAESAKQKSVDEGNSPPSKPIEPIQSDWSVFNSADEMTGEKSSYATSLTVKPNTPMDFPYHDTEAWIGIGCNSTSEWVYIGFNKSPNISNTDTEDGYNVISTRMKWGGVVETATFSQEWGSKFIHFVYDSNAVSNIIGSNTALLELQWHGQRPSYFEFSLRGASEAIKDMRKSCGREK